MFTLRRNDLECHGGHGLLRPRAGCPPPPTSAASVSPSSSQGGLSRHGGCRRSASGQVPGPQSLKYLSRRCPHGLGTSCQGTRRTGKIQPLPSGATGHPAGQDRWKHMRSGPLDPAEPPETPRVPQGPPGLCFHSVLPAPRGCITKDSSRESAAGGRWKPDRGAGHPWRRTWSRMWAVTTGQGSSGNMSTLSLCSGYKSISTLGGPFLLLHKSQRAQSVRGHRGPPVLLLFF